MSIERVMMRVRYNCLVRPMDISAGRWSAMVKMARRELNG